MLPVHYLTGTKILKRARKIMRCLPNFLMREAMNAILGRFRLPAVAISQYSIVKIGYWDIIPEPKYSSKADLNDTLW